MRTRAPPPPPPPRAQSWGDIAKGARYIYVARDPLDAFVSFHKFLPAYVNLEPSDISAEHFAQAQIQQQLGRNNSPATTAARQNNSVAPSQAIFAGASHSGQIWHHYLGWWEAMRARDADVLWVFFEDMCADLPGPVRA